VLLAAKGGCSDTAIVLRSPAYTPTVDYFTNGLPYVGTVKSLRCTVVYRINHRCHLRLGNYRSAESQSSLLSMNEIGGVVYISLHV